MRTAAVVLRLSAYGQKSAQGQKRRAKVWETYQTAAAVAYYLNQTSCGEKRSWKGLKARFALLPRQWGYFGPWIYVDRLPSILIFAYIRITTPHCSTGLSVAVASDGLVFRNSSGNDAAARLEPPSSYLQVLQIDTAYTINAGARELDRGLFEPFPSKFLKLFDFALLPSRSAWQY